jgi:hypothetical protein
MLMSRSWRGVPRIILQPFVCCAMPVGQALPRPVTFSFRVGSTCRLQPSRCSSSAVGLARSRITSQVMLVGSACSLGFRETCAGVLMVWLPWPRAIAAVGFV